MGFDESLNNFSYLWDGSENWILEQIGETRYSIVVHFEERVTAKELVVLRKIFPDFRNRKPKEIKQKLEGLSTWQEHGYNYHAVHNIHEKALKLGLNIEIIGQDLGRYSIYNPDTKVILKIDNETIFKSVIEKMLEAGIHVSYIEID
jgi:hypothetical protein